VEEFVSHQREEAGHPALWVEGEAFQLQRTGVAVFQSAAAPPAEEDEKDVAAVGEGAKYGQSFPNDWRHLVQQRIG